VATAAVAVAVKTGAALALLAALVLLALFGFFGVLAALILQLTQETYNNAFATTNRSGKPDHWLFGHPPLPRGLCTDSSHAGRGKASCCSTRREKTGVI